MEERKALIEDREQRSDNSDNPERLVKVLDFSADTDHEPDSNGEYTRATLEGGPLPESFTVCTAFMVEAWTTVFRSADMFTLLNDDGKRWGAINLFAGPSYTEYEVRVGPAFLVNQTGTMFFPLQWSRACVSLDSAGSKMRVVVDGQLMGEEEYKREADEYKPTNISLMLGFAALSREEYTGRHSEIKIFNSPLSDG